MQQYIEDHLSQTILKRKRNLVDKLSLLLARELVPASLRRAWDPLGELLTKTRVSLLAYSDIDLDLYRQQVWGDYWFKRELTKAIGGMGFVVVDPYYRPDVVVHLFGHPTDLSQFSHAYKVLWIHSNPDKIDATILANYNRICCISETFAADIRLMGFECDHVQQGTSKQWFPASSKQHDVVFVGNARAELGGTRPIVAALGHPDYDFTVWGTGYKTLPSQYWAGEHFDYYALGQLYASSRITLNDHRPAMAAAGFINPRVFDVLAAGGFCISDANDAITQLFGDAVPQYSSPQHLRALIDYYLSHPEERDLLAMRGHSIAIQYTWDRVAMSLLDGISPTYD